MPINFSLILISFTFHKIRIMVFLRKVERRLDAIRVEKHKIYGRISKDTWSRIFTGQGGTGTCSSCSSGYAGANCDVSIPLVVIPTFIVVTTAIVVIILVTIWYIKR